MTERPVVKRTARAVLLDGDDLILIKRTRPGVDPYWLTPGGGVEPGDASVVDALHREVDEELGAQITDVVPCFVDTVEHIGGDGTTGVTGVKVQHFFVCRLVAMDPARRHGPEMDEPQGEYEIVRVPFSRMGIAGVHLVPLSLRHYLDGNIEGVRALHSPDLG
ncbi:NUDIX hydrolase [Streptomyces sp. NPDC006798]|uniref:NUDIX hydrolase n=1 Tax=Streptomyces sp. NPDC006798 TaxID=3155462 RepID=UPI0033FDFB73